MRAVPYIVSGRRELAQPIEQLQSGEAAVPAAYLANAAQALLAHEQSEPFGIAIEHFPGHAVLDHVTLPPLHIVARETGDQLSAIR